MKNKLLLFLVLTSFLFADYYLDAGNEEFNKRNYKRAVDNYKLSKYKDKNHLKLKLITSYLKLGENFLKIKQYKKSLYFYNQAEALNKGVASDELSKVYEKIANRFHHAHNYKKALQFYKKALSTRGNTLKQNIAKIENILKHQKKLTSDTRKVVTKDSPSWTHSIGKLIIPKNLQFINEKRYKTNSGKCSATLVTLDKSKKSSFIITASHCFTQYKKDLGPLKFVIQSKKGYKIYRTAKIEYDSGFDIKKIKTRSDVAILTLNKPIISNDVDAIFVTKDSFSKLQERSKMNYASLVGFSNDIAKYGEKLTYDPICTVKKYNKVYAASTCTGFKGASGGAIILSTKQKNNTMKYNFIGVVSHFKNKSFTNIYFAPHHIFYNRLVKVVKDFRKNM